MTADREVFIDYNQIEVSKVNNLIVELNLIQEKGGKISDYS